MTKAVGCRVVGAGVELMGDELVITHDEPSPKVNAAACQ